jgi:hypothetical protein
VKPDDKSKRPTFAADILQRIEIENNFLAKVLFSDEATFHLSDMVNRHNMRIWGTELPREVMEYQRESPKVNVWCGLMADEVIGPFFLQRKLSLVSYILIC